jgi:phosphoglycolate phosphatase/putative hydrolase of the HAD superfamily
MKTYKLAERRQSKESLLIFDIDGTLYTNEAYLQSQNDLPVERLAVLKGKDFAEMKAEIERYREFWGREHPGQKISLSGVLEAFGVAIPENIRWREELYQPERYLGVDKRLRETLLVLAERAKLAALTNNPVSIARRNLRCLGVEDVFPVLVGLDTCMLPKPRPEPFRKALEYSGTPPSGAVSIGDRYELDIVPALEMGMGGVLVAGVEDVYRLPEVLSA